MKLRNKKTREIVEAYEIDLIDNYVYLRIFRAGDYDTKQYNSLAEFNEEWEDYEESETFWYISPTGTPIKSTTSIYDPLEIHLMKRIGNYFESEEDAEKAVEKQIALTRLEEKGFEFEKWETWEKATGLACFDKGVVHSYHASFTFRSEDRLEKDEQIKADLDICFGGGR